MDTAVWQSLAGGLGGLVRALVGISKERSFRPGRTKIHWYRFFVTIIISVIIGQLAGVIANLDWRMSLLAGYAGSDLIDNLYQLRFGKRE